MDFFSYVLMGLAVQVLQKLFFFFFLVLLTEEHFHLSQNIGLILSLLYDNGNFSFSWRGVGPMVTTVCRCVMDIQLQTAERQNPLLQLPSWTWGNLG